MVHKNEELFYGYKSGNIDAVFIVKITIEGHFRKRCGLVWKNAVPTSS